MLHIDFVLERTGSVAASYSDPKVVSSNLDRVTMVFFHSKNVCVLYNVLLNGEETHRKEADMLKILCDK